MKKHLELMATLVFAVAIVCATGCTKPDDENNSGNGGTSGSVIVTTYDPTSISSNEATCGVEATSDDMNRLLEIGVCWSTSKDPTINDNYKSSKNVDVPFTCTITGLEPGTLYHVRAYALYDSKCYYGDDKTFTTLSNGGGGGSIGDAPEGAINGLFSVSADKQVYFSQGNLQYQASTNTWRFAENQWDFVGGTRYESGVQYGNVYENGVRCNNVLVSSGYDGWIDLFCWGTSGYDHGAVCYQPWDFSRRYTSYFAYGGENFNLYDQSGKADWGYNPISNGGNQENQWRTLTQEEWSYIFNERNTLSGIRFAKANVNSVNGVILFPDNWNLSTFSLNATNSFNASFDNNIVSYTEWNSVFNPSGAVFLPETGISCLLSEYAYYFDYYDDPDGHYWSSDLLIKNGYYLTQIITFGNNELWLDDTTVRNMGVAVRLVQDR